MLPPARLAVLVLALSLPGAPLRAQEPAAATGDGLFFASVDEALTSFSRTQGQLEEVDRLLARARALGLLSDDRLPTEGDAVGLEEEEEAAPTGSPAEAEAEAERAALADRLPEHLAQHAALASRLRRTVQAVLAMASTHKSDLLAALGREELEHVGLVAEALSTLLPDVEVEAAFVRAARTLDRVPARLRASLPRCGAEGRALLLDLGLREKDVTTVVIALGGADGAGVARVVAATASRDPELAAVALRGLGRARPDPHDLGETTRRLEALNELLRGPALSVEARCALVSFMGRHAPPKGGDGEDAGLAEVRAQVGSALRRAWDDQPEEQVRCTIASALGAVEHPEATPFLLDVLSADESTPALRLAALAGLVRTRSLEAVPALIDLMELEALPRGACRKALRTLTGRDYGESHEAWRGWWASR